MATPTVTNIITGGATLWYAPTGEAAPADSTAAGAAWGGNWARLGFTKAPLTAVYETDELDVEVEEHLGPVKRRKISEGLRLETVLAEITSDYLALATSGAATTTAAGASQVGKDELTVGDQAALTEKAWGFEGTYVDAAGASFPVRVFVWKGTAMVNGNLEFSNRNGDYPGVPFQIKALTDPSQSSGETLFKLQRVTAAATA